jgi:hypothetical protein
MFNLLAYNDVPTELADADKNWERLLQQLLPQISAIRIHLRVRHTQNAESKYHSV